MSKRPRAHAAACASTVDPAPSTGADLPNRLRTDDDLRRARALVESRTDGRQSLARRRLRAALSGRRTW